jgi:hypothetical protein
VHVVSDLGDSLEHVEEAPLELADEVIGATGSGDAVSDKA